MMDVGGRLGFCIDGVGWGRWGSGLGISEMVMIMPACADVRHLCKKSRCVVVVEGRHYSIWLRGVAVLFFIFLSGWSR